ncbi:MAG: hypothetical protein IE917_08755 [Betaproteobacteria bacterium]|nr:hypothetical protein [Betaproteobacteria bacterium]
MAKLIPVPPYFGADFGDRPGIFDQVVVLNTWFAWAPRSILQCLEAIAGLLLLPLLENTTELVEQCK